MYYSDMYHLKWVTCLNSEFDKGYTKGYENGYFDGHQKGCAEMLGRSSMRFLLSPEGKPLLSLESIQLVNFNEKKGTTVVKWADGTITKVKVQNGDTYNPEVGLAMCIAKRATGNKGRYNDVFKKWIPKEGQS